MRILVTGATGFIGSALIEALRARGHEPVAAVRDVHAARQRWPGLQLVDADFSRDVDPAAWRGRLDGVDAVVNAVGILRERGAQTFAALHSAAPRALFAAAVEAGVARIVQVSALGADADAASGYHLSKREADDFLRTLPVRGTVIQPSVVFAPQGASAGAFLAMASLPLTALPGGGIQRMAPVHLDDVVEAIVRVLEVDDPPALVHAVGPDCLRMRDYLDRLRRQLGRGPLRVLPVPMPLVRASARLMAHVPGSIVDPDTIGMLERGNCAPADGFAALLGRAPRAVDGFLPPPEGAPQRQAIARGLLLPLLRLSIALVWLVTGLVSLGLYPLDDSRALLARTGLTGMPADVALFGAAALDLLLGVLMLLPINRRPVYLVQIALILGYTAIITFALPEFWLHPYGPVLKNLPILAALWLLYETDRRA